MRMLHKRLKPGLPTTWTPNARDDTVQLSRNFKFSISLADGNFSSIGGQLFRQFGLWALEIHEKLLQTTCLIPDLYCSWCRPNPGNGFSHDTGYENIAGHTFGSLIVAISPMEYSMNDRSPHEDQSATSALLILGFLLCLAVALGVGIVGLYSARRAAQVAADAREVELRAMESARQAEETKQLAIETLQSVQNQADDEEKR